MKSATEQIFDSILKDCFQANLKPLGFKKKGNNFYRQLTDVGQIINIQKSTLFSKEHISFTVNIGRFIPEYWLTYYTYHNGKVPDYPVEPSCAIRLGIGKLKGTIDKWYDIEANSDISGLKKEMMDNILNHILPYFAKYRNKNDVLNLWQDGRIYLDQFVRLIIYGEYNEIEKAQFEYEKSKQDKYVINNLKSTLLEYGTKYNLNE